MRILVLRGGALGDFIVSCPALRLLRERWPSARIELVGNAAAAELGILSGWLDAAHSQHEARWSRFYSPDPLPSELRAWLDDFDLIVSYWPDPDGDLRRHFAPRGDAFISGSSVVTSRPAAAQFCAPLARLGLRADDYAVQLKIPTRFAAEADERLTGWKSFVAVHAGSGSQAKNWPVDRWSELASRIGRPLLAISGEADRDLPNWPPTIEVRTAHRWPLPILAAALARSALFIGHDTGIAHLAAAMDVPCVLLFGSTDPEMWAPPSPQVHVLQRGQRLDAIPVDAVAADVVARLSETSFASTTKRHGLADQIGPA